MTHLRNASIGSISHGTMRTSDLIGTFAWELEHLTNQTADDIKLLAECDTWDEANVEDTNDERQEETGAQLVEALFNALEEHAPAYCYFGANEGDGSDYGFWPAMDAIEYDSLEPYWREVFEHWAVTGWLANQLEARGEKVDHDFAGLCVWARTTTGQAIYADSVIEQIGSDLAKVA